MSIIFWLSDILARVAFGGIFARVRSWVRDRGGFRVRDRVRGCVRGGVRVKVGLGVKMQLMVHKKKAQPQ